MMTHIFLVKLHTNLKDVDVQGGHVQRTNVVGIDKRDPKK